MEPLERKLSEFSLDSAGFSEATFSRDSRRDSSQGAQRQTATADQQEIPSAPSVKTPAKRIIKILSREPDQRYTDVIHAYVLPWLRRNCALLSRLNPETTIDVVKNCQLLEARRDQVIVRQGERGESFYVILAGSVSVYIDELDNQGNSPPEHARRSRDAPRTAAAAGVPVDGADNPDGVVRANFGRFIVNLVSGNSFGELALLSDRDDKRNATVIADETTQFMVVDRKLYERCIRGFQVQELRDREQFIRRPSGLFSRWKAHHQKLLKMSFRRTIHETGSVLCQQGAPALGVHFISRGMLKLSADFRQMARELAGRLGLMESLESRESSSLDGESIKDASQSQLTRRRSFIGYPIQRRLASYLELEGKARNRVSEICYTRGEAEILGDLEVLLGLPSYTQTAVCCEETESFFLDTRSFERLILRRNPKTATIIGQATAEKLSARFSSDRFSHSTSPFGDLPAFPPVLLDAVVEHVLELTASTSTNHDNERGEKKGVAPSRAEELDEADIDFESRVMLDMFLEGRAPLIESDGVVYKKLMRDRADRREHIRTRRQAKAAPGDHVGTKSTEEESGGKKVQTPNTSSLPTIKEGKVGAFTTATATMNPLTSLPGPSVRKPSVHVMGSGTVAAKARSSLGLLKSLTFITQSEDEDDGRREEASAQANKHLSLLRMRLKGMMVKDRAKYADWQTTGRTLVNLEARVERFCNRSIRNPRERVRLPPLKRFEPKPGSDAKPKPGGRVLVRKRACPQASCAIRFANHRHTNEKIVDKLPTDDKRIKLNTVMQLLMS